MLRVLLFVGTAYYKSATVRITDVVNIPLRTRIYAIAPQIR